MQITDRKTEHNGVSFKKLAAQMGQLHTSAEAGDITDEKKAKACYGLLRKSWTALCQDGKGKFPIEDRELLIVNGCLTLFGEKVGDDQPLLQAAVATVKKSLGAMVGVVLFTDGMTLKVVKEPEVIDEEAAEAAEAGEGEGVTEEPEPTRDDLVDHPTETEEGMGDFASGVASTPVPEPDDD